MEELRLPGENRANITESRCALRNTKWGRRFANIASNVQLVVYAICIVHFLYITIKWCFLPPCKEPTYPEWLPGFFLGLAIICEIFAFVFRIGLRINSVKLRFASLVVQGVIISGTCITFVVYRKYIISYVTIACLILVGTQWFAIIYILYLEMNESI